MNGGINGLDEPPTSTSPDDNQSHHNDCSRRGGTESDSRTKVNHLNNLTNHGEDPAKVNNNAGSSRMCFKFQNGASTSRSCLENNSEVDGGLWNNVDSPCEVEKCPSKVRNGSIDGGRRRPRRLRGSDDSSSENEGDEDFCVYTYKGTLQADLPNSFFTLDRLANGLDNPNDEQGRDPLPLANDRRSTAGSSPDNDFLEMDFDPGPSLDLDMDGSEQENDGRVSPIPELPSEENDLSAENQNVESAEYVNNVYDSVEPQRTNSPGPSSSVGQPIPFQAPSAPSTSRRQWLPRDSWGNHCSSGDLCPPWDASESESGETLALWRSNNLKVDGEDTRKKCNLFSDLYHSIMAKRLVMEKNASITEVSKADSNDMSPDGGDTLPVDRTMLWSEQEACIKQVTQISTSACGVTALINVMVALNTEFSVDKLKKGVGTRLRQESAPLPQYLLSRSRAGATHSDLIRGVEAASEGWLYARFFHMHPERRFSLTKWLSYWMRKGAVPVATLNLQAGLAPTAVIPDAWHHQMVFGVSPRGVFLTNPLECVPEDALMAQLCSPSVLKAGLAPTAVIPDAWHHQMVFGVSPRGVFLTNPLECVPEDALMAQLCSPSVLKVKRRDVLQKWTTATDLTPLMCQTDVRWSKLNVLGQVVNMIRESVNSDSLTEHVTIPAAYKSGVTLIIPRDSPGYEELASHPELPIL